MRRIALIAATVLALTPFARAQASAPDLCIDRILVLSAYPGEIDMLLDESGAGSEDLVTAQGRTFYLGTLRGHEVVLALSGIGLVNATHTTEAALDVFQCEGTGTITAIVFSGVAGGPNIGDVMIPRTWTLGVDSFAVDASMYEVASSLAGTVALQSAVPPGDPACAGVDPRLITTVEVLEEPQIRPGGFGSSADGFGGRAFPCFPGGGDVFGCRPCRAPGAGVPDIPQFVDGIIPFIDPNFFFEYFQMPPPPAGAAAVDMETGAVAKVAAAAPLPFIAFRGASDGNGDPLMLPGFPFQFFFYRQLAADNAARVTLAFLDAWADA